MLQNSPVDTELDRIDVPSPAAEFTVPADAQPGRIIHLILEVTDDGTPRLTSYERNIATVR